MYTNLHETHDETHDEYDLKSFIETNIKYGLEHLSIEDIWGEIDSMLFPWKGKKTVFSRLIT